MCVRLGKLWTSYCCGYSGFWVWKYTNVIQLLGSLVYFVLTFFDCLQLMDLLVSQRCLQINFSLGTVLTILYFVCFTSQISFDLVMFFSQIKNFVFGYWQGRKISTDSSCIICLYGDKIMILSFGRLHSSSIFSLIKVLEILLPFCCMKFSSCIFWHQVFIVCFVRYLCSTQFFFFF